MEDPEPPASSGEASNGDISSSTNDRDVGDKTESQEQPESRTIGKWRFQMRPPDDDEPQDWWFASTAIPLLAATTGPLANVMSIAALVTYWRNNFDPNHPGEDMYSRGFPDPHWCIALNATSLACGFIGNIFLLFNFTRRIRYIIALPATIILWYFATGILMGITISMNKFVPPQSPGQVYSQGFWHAVIAATLYLTSSMLLMVNMLGYFLGHYPQHFELTDEQRNLILQTMMFFIWLAAGGAVFAKVCGWQYVDALYFCDVTILTVGFGDFHPTNNVSRGLVFPYSVGGIIILGLMVTSIRKFAQELSQDNIVKSHVEKRRVRTMERSVTTSLDLERKAVNRRKPIDPEDPPRISTPFNPTDKSVTFDLETAAGPQPIPRPRTFIQNTVHHARKPIKGGVQMLKRVGSRKPRLLLLKEEKDRFDAMRGIQHNTQLFKRYYALSLSVFAFGILWCVGAIGFWKAERSTQGLSYFEALYFCYVSLLTIGYGDLSPTSNAGKPYFIVWSLIAVPTMTILISDMGDTVIASFKRGTFTLADWTVLPKEGMYRAFLNKHPWLLHWIQRRASKAKKAAEKAAADRRVSEGFPTGIPDEEEGLPVPTIEELAEDQNRMDEQAYVRKLALAIRRTAHDLKLDPPPRYSYEEWVQFTSLIRFSGLSGKELLEEEEEQELIEWDWIGDNSPMLAAKTESEWVLERLCESMDRYMRRLHGHQVKDKET